MKEVYHTLLTNLKSCSMKRDLQWGRKIHAQALENRIYSKTTVVTALIKMYAKCDSMVDAHLVFCSIQKPSVVPWTALIMGYADTGEGQLALDLFSRMKACGFVPDSVLYVAALKSCTSLETYEDGLERGREIHSQIGCHMDQYVQNTLIDMYAKCGSMDEARCVFDSILVPNVVSWNALLLGYVECGKGCVALDLFSRMKAQGCVLDSVTYVAALKACTSVALSVDDKTKGECLKRGREVHSQIGCLLTNCVQNTLIDMYAKCGSMVEARQVFESITKPTVVSWTALLLGYAESGEGHIALELFSKMKARGCIPNSVTYIAALKACISLAVNEDSGNENILELGREIHSQIGCHMKQSLENTLIDMYSKFGNMAEARRVFDGIQKPNVVSWTALILGYAENGEGNIALDLFSRMERRGCVPDSVLYVAVLKACTSFAVNGGGSVKRECLERGRKIHLDIGCLLDVPVQNTLIDMYAKCGSMKDAHRVFEMIKNPSVVSYTALLSGYADNGEGNAALDVFCKMKDQGCTPNSVTYGSALKACGLIGALTFGRKFHSEISEFNAHLVTCLVDFYAKCGSMKEARVVFDFHSRARDVKTWTSLLAGYAKFGDTASVFNLFQAMQDDGLRPDAVTFVCLLLSCSHGGFVRKAREYLEAMRVHYRVTPTVMHYNCVVDVLGRTNQLSEALIVIRKMPCNPDVVTWVTLLCACRKWMNVMIGRGAFQALLADMNKKNASGYVLMAHIYGSRGMWEEQERVLEVWRLETASTSLCYGESG